MDEKPALGAVLKHGSPVKLGSDEVVLAFDPSSFFGRQAQTPEALKAIAHFAEAVLGARPKVSLVDRTEQSGKTIVEAEHEARETRRRETEERARTHPVVEQVTTLFALPREAMTVHVELE